MKISHLNTVGAFEGKLRQKLDDVGEYFSETRPNLSTWEAVEKLKDAEVAIIAPSSLKPITAEVINQCLKLKHIALVTAGYDWIDIEVCKKRGISISRPLGANSQAVAEHAVGMMIDLAKRISELDRDIRLKGAYDFRDYVGTELTGKIIGVLGMGNIGKLVAGICKNAFSMNVLVFDRPGKFTTDFNVASLEEIFEQANFISVHLPLSDETKNLVGENLLKRIKRGTILVNTAREEIVQKQVVIEMIKSGKLGGYGVETNIMTAVPPDDEYLKYPNILVNTHNAFNTKEAQIRTDQMVVENVVGFIKGTPKNILDI